MKETKSQRRVYTRTELLEQNKSSEKPKDWMPMPTLTQKPLPKESLTKPKIQTLESFILKEIENSVKELEQKRVPFSSLDNNILINRLNPAVEEFLPKVRLNPLAQDFHPY